jgi:probable rRNA maturation factor
LALLRGFFSDLFGSGSEARRPRPGYGIRMEIIFQIDEAFSESVNPALIKKALVTTFRLYKPFLVVAETGTVSMVITDKETVRQLNRQYRDIDAPTDVLSFQNPPDPDFPNGDVSTFHVGDIVIAYPVAEAQALAAGHTASEEVILLAVHGALHLLGFDHDTPTSKEEMWAAQHQIMTELGLAHIQPTEI